MAFKRFLLFGAGIILIFLVLSYFGLSETISVLAETKLPLLALAIILQVAIMGLMIVRIRILAHGRGFLSMARAGRITLSGMFVNMATPFAKLGGEPLKMYMLRSNIGNYNSSAAIAIESLMELVSSLFVVIIIAIVFFGHIPADYVWAFATFLIVMIGVLALMLKIIFTPRWLRRIIKWMTSKAMSAAGSKDHAALFSDAFYDMWKNRKVVLGSFLVSVAMKMIEIARFWIIFYALSVALPLQTVVIVWAVLLVIMFIPWLPGSLGLAEFSAISALIVFGINAHVAASAVILDRLVSFWLPLAVGMAAFSMARQRGELPDFGKVIRRSKQRV